MAMMGRHGMRVPWASHMIGAMCVLLLAWHGAAAGQPGTVAEATVNWQRDAAAYGLHVSQYVALVKGENRLLADEEGYPHSASLRDKLVHQRGAHHESLAHGAGADVGRAVGQPLTARLLERLIVGRGEAEIGPGGRLVDAGRFRGTYQLLASPGRAANGTDDTATSLSAITSSMIVDLSHSTATHVRGYDGQCWSLVVAKLEGIFQGHGVVEAHEGEGWSMGQPQHDHDDGHDASDSGAIYACHDRDPSAPSDAVTLLWRPPSVTEAHVIGRMTLREVGTHVVGAVQLVDNAAPHLPCRSASVLFEKRQRRGFTIVCTAGVDGDEQDHVGTVWVGTRIRDIEREERRSWKHMAWKFYPLVLGVFIMGGLRYMREQRARRHRATQRAAMRMQQKPSVFRTHLNGIREVQAQQQAKAKAKGKAKGNKST